MRWALIGVALLIAVAGLLYRGGLAFVSTVSDGTASRGVGGPGTVAAAAVESPTRADPGPGGPLAATAAPAPSPANPAGPSPASEPGVRPDREGSPEQRVFKSRKALETVDAREFLRHNAMPK